jgi:hypothetical protein
MNYHFLDDSFTTPVYYNPQYTRHPILDVPLLSYPQNIIPEWCLSPDHFISQQWWLSHDPSMSEFVQPALMEYQFDHPALMESQFVHPEQIKDNSVVDLQEEQVSILFALIPFSGANF